MSPQLDIKACACFRRADGRCHGKHTLFNAPHSRAQSHNSHLARAHVQRYKRGMPIRGWTRVVLGVGSRAHAGAAPASPAQFHRERRNKCS
eukprot:1140233-Pelagomonas_calceolata.AAC.1